ncbi:hypothetical protein EDB81DRAFT_180898 [Dactylonectria macrodidyma]|uniref:Uncharacterized protein n=1 Tax=Dactylonectria macrodidyma TaxID=307937 RepID=A0A9P9FRW5_9HYPO|nr:hypothetical protein EDB81DRAFT_180898 [Dactylonectria macrodidyma]
MSNKAMKSHPRGSITILTLALEVVQRCNCRQLMRRHVRTRCSAKPGVRSRAVRRNTYPAPCLTPCLTPCQFRFQCHQPVIILANSLLFRSSDEHRGR